MRMIVDPSEDDVPARLVGRLTGSGVWLRWHGRPRPGVTAYDLYAWRLGPRGEEPVRLNGEPLPVAGDWLDTDIHAPSVIADDPLGEVLATPSRPPQVTVPIWYVQGWIDLLSRGRNPPLRCRTPEPPETIDALAGRYFLLPADRQGGPILLEERRWTPDLDRERDAKIRAALAELRRRGFTLPGDPPPTLEELERHLRGGVTGDRGELGRTEGRTTPAPPDPSTGKGTSEVTLNGNTVLDAEDDQLVALIAHELVHAAQNLDFVVREALKDICINRIEREVAAYDHIWTAVQNGQLRLRPGLLIREAREATLAIMELYKQFAAMLLELEEALTDAQKASIRALRRRIRALLLRYQAFLATAPQAAIDALGSPPGPNGEPMNTKQLVDYLLDRAFRSDS